MPIALGVRPPRTRIRAGWTLIRKTSLLHKIDPTARRSSFADMSAARDLRREKRLEIARRT
jgi:hypothetical protein